MTYNGESAVRRKYLTSAENMLRIYGDREKL